MRLKPTKRPRPIIPGKSRKCDACPVFYIPLRKDHRFHAPQCRADWHRYGPVVERFNEKIEQIALRIEYALWRCFTPPMRLDYARNQPERAAVFTRKESTEG